jgi:hypothetical protein
MKRKLIGTGPFVAIKGNFSCKREFFSFFKKNMRTLVFSWMTKKIVLETSGWKWS